MKFENIHINYIKAFDYLTSLHDKQSICKIGIVGCNKYPTDCNLCNKYIHKNDFSNKMKEDFINILKKEHRSSFGYCYSLFCKFSGNNCNACKNNFLKKFDL